MLSKISQLRSPLSSSSLSSNQPSSSGASTGGQNSPNSSTGSNSSYNNSDRTNPLSSSSSFASFLSFDHHHRTHYHNPLESESVVSRSQLNQVYDHRPSLDQVIKSATVRGNSSSSNNSRQKHNTMATSAVATGSTSSQQQSMFKVSCNSLIQLNQLQGVGLGAGGSSTTAPRPFARKKNVQQQLNQSELVKKRTVIGSARCNNEFKMMEIVNTSTNKINGSTSCINLESLNVLSNNSGNNCTSSIANKSNFNRSIRSLNQSRKQTSAQTLQSSANSVGSVAGIKSASSSSPASRRSPNTPDLGYNTLLSSFTSNEMPSTSANKSGKESIKSTGALHYNSSSLTKSYNTKHAKKKLNKKASLFDKLTDEVIGKIFSFFTADELVASAPKVCKRWYSVIWTSPVIWNKITFSDVHYINIDQGLKSILKCLTKGQNVFSSESNSDENLYLNFYSLKRTNSSQLVATNCSTENLASNSDSVSSSTSASSMVEVIKINSMGNSSTLTDRGLMYIAGKCSELQSLVIFSSTGITDLGLSEVLSRCNKLHKLDLTGCVNISLNTSKAVNYPQLNYLDVSNCSSVDDYTLRKFIKSYGSRLQFFYCRRNDKVSDEGISIMVKYCPQLKEVSLNDCPRITDLTCIELSSKLGTNLKYLSLSKCEHVTDQGLEQMSRFCFKLRYLNVRGCPGISDSGVSAIARSCGPRLRALDVGKCDITDEGLKILSENCTNLRKLGLRDCQLVSDTGISLFAYYCRNLIHLNIVNCCNITREAYLYVKRCNKKCKIEHSNSNFY